MKKKLLNQQAAAVLEAGGSLETALEVAEEINETPEASGAESADPVAAVEKPAADEKTDETPAAEASVPQADVGLVSFLKAELAAANEKVLQATLESRNLKAQLDSLNATHAQMRSIVIDSANTKRIALGGSAMDMATLSDEAILQTYQQTTAEFSKAFPIGGKLQAPSTEQPKPVVNSAMQARVNAVRVNKS